MFSPYRVYDSDMIYQRHIPKDELFSAQLETLMQNSRVATLGIHLSGILATILMFWSSLDAVYLFGWAGSFVGFLLLSFWYTSNALSQRRYQVAPARVYWRLIILAGLTGAAWSVAYLYAAPVIPKEMQHVFLMLIVIIAALSVGVTVVVREYFIVYLFASIWPIAWWTLVHYWEQPHNLIIGIFLLLICAVLVCVTNRMYETFRNLIASVWEREAISQELGVLTSSLRGRNTQLRDARKQLTELANVDELTGLGNRRMVNTVLKAEINRSRRSGTPLSIILLDVDYFKNYNDTYGHLAGDGVLQLLSEVMRRAATRAGEVVGRFGGEEFILILPGANNSAAVRTARRLQTAVNREHIAHSSSKVANHLTVSQGLVTARPSSELEPGQLIELADKALYEAKGAGRNCIKTSDASDLSSFTELAIPRNP
jgi:diguanylate cyclase (GGDEF)-like protein